MRRKEKEVKDRSEIEAIIHKSPVCRVAMCEDNKPYVVPLNFGYEDGILYFHGAKEGKKIDMIRKNPHICFEMDTDVAIVEADDACFWGVRYQSVIGFGEAAVVPDHKEKESALGIIMKHYSQRDFQFDENMVKATAVIKVVIDSMTGKQSVEG
jgi:uncharacterized protein